MDWKESIAEAHTRLAEVSQEPKRGQKPYYDFTPISLNIFAGAPPQVRYTLVSAEPANKTYGDMYDTGTTAFPMRNRIRARVVGLTTDQTKAEAMVVMKTLQHSGVSEEFTGWTWENTTDHRPDRGNYAVTFDFFVDEDLTVEWTWDTFVVIETEEHNVTVVTGSLGHYPVLSGSNPG